MTDSLWMKRLAVPRRRQQTLHQCRLCSPSHFPANRPRCNPLWRAAVWVCGGSHDADAWPCHRPHPAGPGHRLARRFRGGAGRARHRPRGREVRHRQLLARPRRVHLEHQDRRGPRPDRRHARRAPGRHRPVGLPHPRGRRPTTAAWSRRSSSSRPPSAAASATCGSKDDAGVDAADGAAGTQGPRGAQGPVAGARRRARRRPRHRGRGRRSVQDEEASLGYTTQPYALVVGGGQGGIALGARLRQLGVPAIVVDKHERPGDQWRKRYKSLCLHDPVWYDHLPYLPFPQNWPVFAPKDKIGDWLEFYTRVMEVPYWSKTTCLSASFDEDSQDVDRRGGPRRRAAHPAPDAAGAGHRHVGQAERADAARPGRVPRRPAPLQRAPRPGRATSASGPW